MASDNVEKKVEEARQILVEELKKKQKAFVTDYDAICKKHGMRLEPQTVLNIVEVKN